MRPTHDTWTFLREQDQPHGIQVQDTLAMFLRGSVVLVESKRPAACVIGTAAEQRGGDRRVASNPESPLRDECRMSVAVKSNVNFGRERRALHFRQ